MRKLFFICIKNSIRATTIYPIHTVITFIYAILTLILNLFFWFVLNKNFGNIGFYGIQEIMILNIFVLLGDCIGGFFFGFRDLPYCINDGDFDKYLILPRRDIFLFLLENIPIIYMIQQFIIFIVGFISVVIVYDIKFSFINFIISLISLFIGILILNLFYGAITMISFVIDRFEGLRELIFSLSITKNYPLTIFPDFIQKFLTYIVPVSLISYYPTMFFFGSLKDYKFIFIELVILIVFGLLYEFIHQKVILSYTSNGG